MDEQRPWHRLFALSWMDFFRGLPVTVEPEKDLSLKRQLLDVVLIRKDATTLDCRMPDGMADLAAYNLVSFKSHKDKLSAWSLEELLGHYVNLRKQVSPSTDEADLLQAADFRLFAVCARFPRNLADDGVTLRGVQEGVYEVEALSRRVRVIVTGQLPRQEQNAMLHMYSANGELLAYGIHHYRVRSPETSTLLMRLYHRYRKEELIMPDALEELTQQTIDELLASLPAERLLKVVSDKDRLEGVSVEKRLEGVPVEKRLEDVPVEEVLAALPMSPEVRQAVLRLLKANGSEPPK